MLLGAASLLELAPVSPSRYPVAQFAFYAAIFIGILLVWRFRSARVFSVLLVLLLMEASPAGPGPLSTSVRLTFVLATVLLPLNYLIFALLPERGFSLDGLALRVGVLLADFVAVGINDHETGAAHLHRGGLPWAAVAVFAITGVVLLIRFVKYAKPVEIGFFWSLVAVWMALRSGGSGTVAMAYMATAALIVCASMIETWYFLAYHDELTGLPSRRAFNEALGSLRAAYSIAVADVDHFKAFNDLYGHDTGDEVLRLVGGQLARCSGGGQAFRVGGEEFAVLFREKTAAETLVHLESLRTRIAESRFIVRGVDRRKEPRGPERRRTSKESEKLRPEREIRNGTVTSVTISIGVGACEERASDSAAVIAAADKALYRAKKAGRNRVEIAGAEKPRSRPKKTRTVAVHGA